MTSRTAFTCAGALLIMAAALLLGCDEKDVPYYSDTEEITRYIYESEDARELFRTQGLIVAEPFEFPWEPGVLYINRVDSIRRQIDVDLGPEDKLRRVGSLPSFHRDAEVTVDDILYISQRRIEGIDTSVTMLSGAFNRYGYFLKLGQDNHSFLGWKMWGYNGGTGTADQGSQAFVNVQKPNGSTFLGNGEAYDRLVIVLADTTWSGSEPTEILRSSLTVLPYRRLDQIDTLRSGDSLVISAQWNRTAVYLMTAYTSDGLTQDRLEPAAATAETLVVHTPAPNERLWNVIAAHQFLRRPIQGSNPPEYTVTWSGWTIPYRVPQ